MPAWMIQFGFTQLNLGNNYYCQPCSWHTAPNQVEAQSQMIARDSYTLDRMYVRVTVNTFDAATPIVSRVGGGDGNQAVNVGAGTTGVFEDNANNDALVTGNLFDTEVDATPSVGGTMTIGCITYRLATASNTTPIIGGAGNFYVDDGETKYLTLMGRLDDRNTEADTQYTFRVAATLYNMWFYVTTNTLDGIADVTLRINGAGGNLTVAVGAGTTGAFEDAANNDVIASGNNVNYEIAAAGTSGSIYIDTICIKSDSDGRQTAVAYPFMQVTHSWTRYTTVEGGVLDTFEAFTQSKTRTALTATNGFVRVISNSLNGATTYTLRKGGANTAISISVGATLTGAFEDSDSVGYAEADLINWMIVTAGSAGWNTFGIVGFEQQQASAAGWTGKISGVTNPAAIMGVLVANIAEVKGVA